MDRKSVHVKLTKETHTALREKLFRYGITMQDLFQETVDSVLREGDKADNMLHRIAKKRMLSQLEKIDRKRHIKMGEFDSETLYNLLESDERKSKE